MIEDNNKVVYVHREIPTGRVFYVGMGLESRPCSIDRSEDWLEYTSNNEYEVFIIATDLSEIAAWDMEAGLIELYGFDNLLNKTRGNQDAVDRRRGKIPQIPTHKKTRDEWDYSSVRDKNFSMKLLRNAKVLERIVEMYNNNQHITIKGLGLNSSTLFPSIAEIVYRLQGFTSYPFKSDALDRIKSIHEYLSRPEFNQVIVSQNKIKEHLGGSRAIIKVALESYYTEGYKVYKKGSESVIEDVKYRIANPQLFTCKIISYQGDKRITLEFKN